MDSLFLRRPGPSLLRPCLAQTAIAALLILAGSVGPAVAVEAGAVELREERAFLERLREARLYTIAEEYLAERSTAADLSPQLRELYARERIELLKAAALDAPAEERPERLAKIEQIATEYQATDPPLEPAVEVLLAAARARLALADQWRQEAELGSEDAREQALSALRAIERDLDRGLALSIQLSAEAARKPGSTAERRALALSQELRFVSALVYRVRALCYPPGSPDRFNAQGQAAERLDDLASRMSPDQAAWVRTLAERARAYREIRQFDQARATLERIAAERAPAEFAAAERDAYYEERLRLLAEEGDPDAALGLWERIAPGDEPPSAELGLVAVDLFLARAKQLREEKDETRAANWERKAADAAKYLETRFGPYWGRLAGRRLVESGGSSAGGADGMSRLAEDHLRRKNLTEAVAAYDRAAELAREAGSPDANLFAYRAALVEQARKNYGLASERFSALSQKSAPGAEAAERHYLAIWNAAQQARIEPERTRRYADLLQEHLDRYPASPRIGHVRLWSGRLALYQGDLRKAFDLLVAVPPASDAFAEAAPDAVQAAERLSAKTKPEDVGAVRAALQRSLEQALDAAEAHVREAADEGAIVTAVIGAAALATGAGRLALETDRSDPATASDLADRALAMLDRAEGQDVSALRSQALALRVIAGFDDPKRTQPVDDALAELAASGTASLEPASAGLERALQDASEPRRQAAAKKILQGLALLPDAERNDATQSARAAELRAKALAALGRGNEAFEDLKRLAAERPDDAEIQLLYARALSESAEAGDQRAALDRWRKIAASAQPRSDLWFEAKLAVAQRQIALGQAGEAATLLRYVQLAPPGVAGTKWEAPYREALRQAEAKAVTK
ncbi:MAG TPA: hypothetical protein VGN57_07630 [Pirellulaceae bacterium]|jgi:hypothetical protein|nr:hypothetical protein [Pirellulaceae bacterium]